MVSLIIAASVLIGSWGISEEHTAVGRLLSTHSTETENNRIRTTSQSDIGLSTAVPVIPFDALTPNDPYSDRQWALGQIRVSSAWQITMGDPKILVAVLDTGIDRHHEDLEGKVVAEANFTDSPTSEDINGHGTHIAGIIVGTSNNGIGVAGLAPESRVLNVKVADDKGRCQPATVARGIIWAVDNGASVINISLELREDSAELEHAINYAWSRGAIIIAAAGNDGDEFPIYPAYYENCVAVVATRQNDTLAPLSNHGDWVDVAAPGFNIYSTVPNNGYGYQSGTSFAAAYVSGLAALLFSIATDINGDGRLNDEVRAAIEAGCHRVGINGIDKGRIDAVKAFAEIGIRFNN